jgi:TPR repeat protein
MSNSCRAILCAAILVLADAQVANAADMNDVRRALADQRYFDAFADLQELAADGNPEAQFELAGFHHYGRIGPANFEKALGWYTRSANQGNVDSMIGLAVMFGKGEGVPRDPEAAYLWLATARLMPPARHRRQPCIDDGRVSRRARPGST